MFTMLIQVRMQITTDQSYKTNIEKDLDILESLELFVKVIIWSAI